MTLAAGTLVGFLAFWASPQDDKAVQSAIKKFREEYYKVGAKEDDKISAVNYLGQIHHDRIVSEFAPLITDASIPVRVMTSRMPSQFCGMDSASNALLAALKAQANSGKKQACVRIEILRALGTLKYRPAGPEIAKMVDEREVWVAKAAIDACGKIRVKEAIDPLLKQLRRIEGVAGDAEVNPLDEVLEGVSRGSLLKPDPATKRPSERDVLRAPILASLSSITNQSLSSSKEWDAWWSKNKASFRVSD